MPKLSLVKGTTSYSAYVFIQDSSVSTGAGLTGLAFNTANLVASYVRARSARVAITLATQAVTGAWSSGGFVEVDSTNCPGLYRLDVPDAALASGVNAVVVMLKGATNMAPVVFEIELTGVDNQDAADFGLSNLDATISSRLASASYTAPDNATIASIQVDTDNLQTRLPAALVGGRMDSSVGAMASDTLTSAALAASAVAEIQSGLSTLTAAQVRTEVQAGLATDTYAEPGSVPAATATLAAKIGWLFTLARNKRTTTSTTDTLRNDGDSGTIATSTISDDGTTFTRGKYS